MPSSRGLIIAIDGPAGAGKTTVAERLARMLDYASVSTGDMYRALTLKAIRQGIPFESAEALCALARTSDIRVSQSRDGPRVILDGEDVTDLLRDPGVNSGVSPVSKVPGVREVLSAKQRALALCGSVVMEGRDIGTVVAPEADRKFFLVASVDERARRKLAQLLSEGHTTNFETVRADIVARDERDSNRAIAPLKPAPDAVVIDTNSRSVDDVVQEIARRL